MSQENINLLYRLADALNAREVPDFIAPDYRLENVITAVTDKTYIGPDGWRDWMGELLGAFAVISSLVGRGTTSDAPLQLSWVSAVWFRDGQMIRSSGFRKRHEALEAVGLRE